MRTRACPCVRVCECVLVLPTEAESSHISRYSGNHDSWQRFEWIGNFREEQRSVKTLAACICVIFMRSTGKLYRDAMYSSSSSCCRASKLSMVVSSPNVIAAEPGVAGWSESGKGAREPTVVGLHVGSSRVMTSKSGLKDTFKSYPSVAEQL